MTTTTVDAAVEVERRPVTRYDPATGRFEQVDGELETRDEREARLRAWAAGPDAPICDMKVAARILGISHQRVRFMHAQREDAERLAEHGSPREQAEARDFLLDAIPHTAHRVGRQPVWRDMWAIFDFGRRNQQLDEWYEPRRKPPGGAPGSAGVLSRQPTMTSRVKQLRGQLDADGTLDRLDPDLRERVAGEVHAAYTAHRDAKVRAARARAAAIAEVAEHYADRVPATVVEYLLLDHLVRLRR